MPLSVADFAAKIKAQYPDYANVPDDELARRIVAKYPQYATQVDFGAAPQNRAPKDESFMDRVSAAAHALNQIPQDLVIGAAKGVGSTITNLGKLAHNLPGMNAIAPDEAGAFQAGSPAEQALQANGTAQKIGKGAEQIGEFFVPGMAEAGKLAPVANAVGKLGLAGKIGTEAASAAAVTEAQGGNPIAGAIGGAAGAGLSAAVGKLAPKMVNTLIGAKRAQFRTGANPGEGVVNEGLVSPTLSNLADKIDSARDTVGAKIGNVLGLSPKANTANIDAMPLIDGPIQEAQQALAATGNKAGVARLNDMRQGIYDELTNQGLSPNNVSPRDLFNVNQLFKKVINFNTNDTVEAAANAVLKRVRRNFANAISDAVPEVAPLNQRYANLAEASDAIAEKLNGSQGMNMASIASSPFNWLLGAGIGYYRHDPILAAKLLAIKTALTSTPAVTAGAQAARAIGSEAGRSAGAAVGGALGSAATQPNQMSPEEMMQLLQSYGTGQ